ncbi:hypothetical protein HY230_06850 [Candidatus Acetothermia bacterium]|nr:hypothetical protein [Candidatus Acetothermia bacterium]
MKQNWHGIANCCIKTKRKEKNPKTMSLGIAFKGPEGIVLAADSRVTLTAEIPEEKLILPATFDNATKLLRVKGQPYVGAVTYGLGALGTREPRTAHSFLPEFEFELHQKHKENDRDGRENQLRLSVKNFATELSDFFKKQWDNLMPKDFKGPDMVFFIGGYDEGAPYGKVFEVKIPSQPIPFEWHIDSPVGVIWGGQKEFTDRLIQGFDDKLPEMVTNFLQLPNTKANEIREHLKQQLSVRIPYQFLPLQDCVDLAIFLIRTTINIQNWYVGVRGVGGAIDVATITRIDGFKPIQQKNIVGERT